MPPALFAGTESNKEQCHNDSNKYQELRHTDMVHLHAPGRKSVEQHGWSAVANY
jgi:hypothetical protein